MGFMKALLYTFLSLMSSFLDLYIHNKSVFSSQRLKRWMCLENRNPMEK
jgi:hypothetical protein